MKILDHQPRRKRIPKSGQSRPITIEALNQLHREFWASQEAPREEPSTHPGVAALVREAHRIELQQLHVSQSKLRTEAATQERRDKGDATRDAVLMSAKRILAERGSISRASLSGLIAADLNLSADHVRRVIRLKREK